MCKLLSFTLPCRHLRHGRGHVLTLPWQPPIDNKTFKSSCSLQVVQSPYATAPAILSPTGILQPQQRVVKSMPVGVSPQRPRGPTSNTQRLLQEARCHPLARKPSQMLRVTEQLEPQTTPSRPRQLSPQWWVESTSWTLTSPSGPPQRMPLISTQASARHWPWSIQPIIPCHALGVLQQAASMSSTASASLPQAQPRHWSLEAWMSRPTLTLQTLPCVLMLMQTQHLQASRSCEGALHMIRQLIWQSSPSMGSK